MYDTEDTIVAVASAPSGARRGIVRLSGSETRRVLVACVDEQSAHRISQAEHPAAFDASIVLAAELPTATPLPCRILFWPTVRSYTRQPAAEVHTIGSLPLLDAVVRRLLHCGARRARPGEFTMRAFLAGRIDLTQAEAVLGVIDAEDQAELKTALDQLAGGLAGPLQKLRERLLEILADVEAGLDFVDEDIEFISSEELCRQLATIRADLSQLTEQIGSRGESRAQWRIVLHGPPNTGKSSLLNALAGHDAAIVSSTPGTTRDYLALPLRLGKHECLLVDTAGVELYRTDVEASAQNATSLQQQNAHLVLRCVEAPQLPKLTDDSRPDAQEAPETLVVVTKCDLLANDVRLPDEWVATSATESLGIDRLVAALEDKLSSLTDSTRSLVLGTTAERCRAALAEADASLMRAEQAAALHEGDELVALEIRTGLQGLGEIAGTVYTDDLLDRIFSRFCIGK